MGIAKKIGLIALLAVCVIILFLAVLTVVFMCYAAAQDRRWKKENPDADSLYIGKK